jgi:hypothetical protein
MLMRRLMTLIMWLIVLPVMAVAATIHVPSDQPTIQAGIDAAVDGDTVSLAPGTYGVDSVVVLNKTLTIRGSFSPDTVFISGRIVIDHADLTIQKVVISGIGSNATSMSEVYGGALRAAFSNLRADSMIIQKGTAKRGGAICVSDGGEIAISHSVVNGRVVADESVYSGTHGMGGAIYVQATDFQMTDCHVDGSCVAESGRYGGDAAGGGLFLVCSSVCLMGNVIRGSAHCGMGYYCEAYGGGMACQASYVHASDNDISGAVSVNAYHERPGEIPHGYSWGGGASLTASTGTLRMNSIHDSYANADIQSWQGEGSALARGGGLYIEPGNAFLVERCSLVSNQATVTDITDQNQVAEGGAIYTSNACTVRCNTFATNEPDDVVGTTVLGCETLPKRAWHVSVDGDNCMGDGSVSRPFPQIQSAINAATDGDTVLVAPGTYRGTGNRNIGTNGKRVVVKGAAGSDSTILSCEGDTSAFTMKLTREDTSTVIEGLTITGAVNGMVLNGSGPRVQDICFKHNIESGIVAGISGEPSALISRCRFVENGSSGISQVGHGNLSCKRCVFTGNPTGIVSIDRLAMTWIDSCAFESNHTALNGQCFVSNSVIRNGVKGVEGGGGWSYGVVLEYHFSNCVFEGMTGTVVEATSSTELFNSLIRSNPGEIGASSGNYGEDSYSLRFTDCTIEGNGGGITASGKTNLSLIRCVYSSNGRSISFSANPYFGRCLHAVSSTIVDNLSDGLTIGRLNTEWPCNVENTLIANNGGVGFSCNDTNLNMLNFSCNNVYGNQQGDYSVIADQTGTNGNISIDPLFCDTASGDFQVQKSSPCAPNNNGCGVLIGVFGIGCQGGDADGDGSVTIADAVFLVNYIFIGGPAPEPISQGDADCSDDINIADAVVLINYIFSSGPAPCYAP